MSKRIFRITLLTLLIAGQSTLGLAQRTLQTGLLNGTLKDDEGNPLPGVTVVAGSPSLILPQVSTITDEKGFYRLPQLTPGIYKVVFELAGFKKVVREGIKISIGTTTLNITMELSPISETVIIIGQAPTVDKKSTSLSLTIDRDILVNIPAARDFESVFQMAPGVISVDGRTSSLGSSVLSSAFNLDGVNIIDPITGMYGSIQVPYEIAEEYEIETGGHKAEYGSVQGSLINLITKSGGNKFSGEVNGYFRNKALQSDNTKGTPFEGMFVGFNYEIDTTFQLGGPIIKNKMSFFVNYSYRPHEVFVEGYPYDKDEHVPTDYNMQFPFFKLSWQINPAMKLIGSWNVWKAIRHHRDASMYRNEDTTRIGDFLSHTVNIAYSYITSKNLIFTAKVCGALMDLALKRKNDKPAYYEYNTRTYSGGFGYDQIPKRGMLQFLSDVTYFNDNFYGRHEFKAGFEFEFTSEESKFDYVKDPRNGIGYFLETLNGAPYIAYDYENYTRKDYTYLGGFYIQDSWSPVERLTFNLGIRLDHQEAVVPKQGEDRTPAVYQGVTYDPRVTESFKPFIWNTLSPRLGAIYDLTGDGKTVIKANFGRYYPATLIQFFYKANPNGYIIRYYRLNSDWSIKNMYSFLATAATKIDPNLKAPHTDEFIIGIQRELFTDFSLSINYIRRWERNLVEDVTDNALDVAAIKKGEYIWSNYTPVTAIDPYDGNTVTFYERSESFVAETSLITNPEPSKRDYSSFEVLIKKRLSHKWLLLASYVYAKSTGLIGTSETESAMTTSFFNNPNSHINALGRLPGERRHQIRLQGAYQAPFGISISTYYRGLAGNRYTRVIRASDLGLSLNQGSVAVFAEEKGARGLPWLHLWNIRVEKAFRMKDFAVGLIVDVFDTLNLNTTTSLQTISSSKLIKFEEVTGIVDPRSIRLGIRIRW